MPQIHYTLTLEFLSTAERRAVSDQVDDLASLVRKGDEETLPPVKDREVVLPPQSLTL